jgi:hypothetical protein
MELAKKKKRMGIRLKYRLKDSETCPRTFFYGHQHGIVACFGEQ